MTVLPDCHYHAVSAMDESELGIVGRPFGGCSLLWHSDLALSLVPIKTISPGVCSVEIRCDDFKMLIINVYMPGDDNNDNNVYMQRLYLRYHH